MDMKLSEQFEEIINDLQIPTDFCVDRDSDDPVYTELYTDINWYKNGVDYANGVTKFVLLHDGDDVVVKIPFMGWAEYSEWDEEEEEYVDLDEPNVEEFSGAALPVRDLPFQPRFDWDYCAREEFLFKVAEGHGFGEFFAETKYLKDIDGHPVYIQEKVEAYGWDRESKVSEKTKQTFLDSPSLRGSRIADQWVMEAIEWYGAERVEKLLVFLHRYDMDSDLHTGNIGYRLNGAPVIIDYSGFDE